MEAHLTFNHKGHNTTQLCMLTRHSTYHIPTVLLIGEEMGFYLMYLQRCETSWYRAPQPFTALCMDPLALIPARPGGMKDFPLEERERRLRTNQGLRQTVLLRGRARTAMTILAHDSTTASAAA